MKLNTPPLNIDDAVRFADSDEPETNLKNINEDLSIRILKASQELMTFVDVSSSDAIYTVVKATVRHPSVRNTMTDTVGCVFAYYLRVSYLHDLSKNPDASEGTSYAKASMSIFDLYINDPTDRLLRKLVVVSADSLRDIIIAIHSNDKSLSTKCAIEYISNITMLTGTIKPYLKDRYYKSNLEYIGWIKSFLLEGVLTNSLQALFEGAGRFEKSQITSVIKQVTLGTKVILVEKS
jgi:hypothetical protein